MYYPILRGKQMELLAIRDVVEKIALERNLTPVIDPVNLATKDLLKCLSVLEEEAIESIVIINPENGDIAKDLGKIEPLINTILSDYPSVSFAIITRRPTTATRVKILTNLIKGRGFYLFHQSANEALDELLQVEKLPNFKGSLVNTAAVSTHYHNLLSQNHKIIGVSDPFRKKKPNEEYRRDSDEFFSEDHVSFRSKGYSGFGDYLTVGSEYSTGGTTPNTVAIHVTYENKKNEIRIRHILSEHYEFNPNASEMIAEAISNLQDLIDEYPELLAISQSLVKLTKSSSTNLPGLKRLSLAHHMELMMHLLPSE